MQEEGTVLSAYACADCACTSNILIDCAHRPVVELIVLARVGNRGQTHHGYEDEHVYPPMRTHSDPVIVWPSHI